MSIPAQLIDPLSTEVARVFDLKDLDRLMTSVTGAGLAEKWAGPGQTVRDTAFEMLQAVSREGIERVVLAGMLRRRPNAAELAELIRRICPEAFEAIPGMDSSVQTLIGGLATARQKIDDPEVRGLLTAAADPLHRTLEAVDCLNIYKSLHEYLHLVQAKQYRALRDAARRLPESPEAMAELVIYHTQLRDTCLLAREVVARLPGPAADQRTETLWIDLLEQAGSDFHDAVLAQSRPRAQAALRVIREVMLTTPRRLDSLIFVTAQDLPLDEIAALLDKLAHRTAPEPELAGAGAPAPPAPDPQLAVFARAHDALAVIVPRLRAEVTAHRDWQDIDNRISRIEQLFDGNRDDLIEDFAVEWFALKGCIAELLARDESSDGGAPPRIQTYIAQVDEALTRETADTAFDLAFLLFTSEAQHHFLGVDARLKKSCGELIRIGDPLRDIIGAL